jgi:hypothetical protein
MAKQPPQTPSDDGKSPNTWRKGHLGRIDLIPHGDPRVATAINEYGDFVDTNRSSSRWAATIQWIENILFGAGRQYIDDILSSRINYNSNSSEASVVQDTLDNVPRPVNDLLGRYIETNIALFTENKPMPRVSAKSDSLNDQKAADLSELTLEYLWEALDMPEKNREICRLMLYCGTAFKEIAWDDSVPRHMSVPQTETSPYSFVRDPVSGAPIKVPVARQVQSLDSKGDPKMQDQVEYGDVSARIVSPFEIHVPNTHYWEDIDWVMREYYTPIDSLKSKYEIAAKRRKNVFKKSNGWFLENLDKVFSENVTRLPLWWWERLTTLVEGPGQSLYIGSPEQWDGYCVVRIFDRKPSDRWPKGRTVITAGNQLLYDSPMDRGARAYDPRWPNRWHPYVRYRWEPMPGSIWGRSLVSKLLPKLKRVNAIDTTMIMWRRTIPMSAWIAPKGSHPQKDLWSGKPGLIWEYDPRQTAGMAPEVIHPPAYPEAALREREQQLQEMEFIAGTEQVLRGERPQGVNSAAALDMLRKQALSSRSACLQAWDESLEREGSALLQEVIRNVRVDPRYLERIKILAREKMSALTIHQFSGEDLSDNVGVRIDTASMALLSKEAREAKTIEFLQYAGNLMQLPFGLQQAVLDRLGIEYSLQPQGLDVERIRRMITWIKAGDFTRVIPQPEDDPFVAFELLTQETKKDSWWDMRPDSQQMIHALMDKYKMMIEFRQMQQMQMQAQQVQAQGGQAPGQPPPQQPGKGK